MSSLRIRAWGEPDPAGTARTHWSLDALAHRGLPTVPGFGIELSPDPNGARTVGDPKPIPASARWPTIRVT